MNLSVHTFKWMVGVSKTEILMWTLSTCSPHSLPLTPIKYLHITRRYYGHYHINNESFAYNQQGRPHLDACELPQT